MKLLIPLAASVLVLGNQAFAHDSEDAMNRIMKRYKGGSETIQISMDGQNGNMGGGHVEARKQYRHGGDGSGDRIQTRAREREQVRNQVRTQGHDH